MLALYRSGRQADALEVYRSVRRRLSDELGLQPGQELRDARGRDPAAGRRTRSRRRTPTGPPGADRRDGPAGPAACARRAARRRWLQRLAIVALAARGGRRVASSSATRRRRSSCRRTRSRRSTPRRTRSSTVLPTGIRPGPVAGGAGSVWVGNLDDTSLTRVDLATRAVVRDDPPCGDADRDRRRTRRRLGRERAARDALPVDPQFERVDVRRVRRSLDQAITGRRRRRRRGIGLGGVRRLDARARRPRRPLAASASATAGAAPAALVVAYGAVWVANSGGRHRPALRSAHVRARRRQGRSPSAARPTRHRGRRGCDLGGVHRRRLRGADPRRPGFGVVRARSRSGTGRRPLRSAPVPSGSRTQRRDGVPHRSRDERRSGDDRGRQRARRHRRRRRARLGVRAGPVERLSFRQATARSSTGRSTMQPTRSETSVASLTTFSGASGATSRASVASTSA